MKKVIEVIEKLRTISGNEQISFLKEHVYDELLKEILRYTYNDNKYNINEDKYNKVDILEYEEKLPADTSTWITIRNQLDELANKKSAKDKDVKDIKTIIENCENPKFFRQILFKDLRINMGVKTLNKVYGDFCIKPQVQLANKFIGKGFENGVYSRKFDGKRMYVLDGQPFSRTNKECNIAPIQHLLDELNKIPNIKDIVFDGENLYFDENGKEDFQKGISLTSKEERTEECGNICYVIFDMLPRFNFVNKEPFVEFHKEYQLMLDTLADYTKETPCYSLIPTKLKNIYIARQDKDMSILQDLRNKNNWEGLMYRNSNAYYEYKRTNNLLKIKKMQDSEFDIVDFKEGTGKNKDTLGAVVIKLPSGELVDVGSGFSDEDRNYIWNNKQLILDSGYQLKVQYFEETKDKNGNNSLRFPVFKAFRKDNVEVMKI